MIQLPIFDGMGFTDITTLTLAAGINTLLAPVNPPHYLKKITALAWNYTGTITSVKLYPSIVRNSTLYNLNSTLTVISGQYYFMVGVEFWLNAGNQMALYITGATVNNVANLVETGNLFRI